MSTFGDLIADSLREIGVYNPIDTLAAVDAAQGARRLNRILDSWSARRAFAFATQFSLYTLTAGYGPNQIGANLSAPDFATPGNTARPTRILSASLVLNDASPDTDLPMNLRDRAWWADQRVKGLESNVPTDLFYQPLCPNGALNFWPVPDYNYPVRLETEVQVSQIPLNSSGLPNFAATFSAAQGYELAIVLTLAEYQCVPYGKPLPPNLAANAARARAVVGMNNMQSPRCQSADWGTNGVKSPGRADFNWQSGLPS